jgi:hypothetical protein
MSDLVALVCTVALAVWFVGLSSLLAVDNGGAWVPKAPREIARFADRSPGRRQRRVRNVVSSSFLVLSQVTAVGAIAGNVGRASLSVILILSAEPIFAAAWAAYLVRSASPRGV